MYSIDFTDDALEVVNWLIGSIFVYQEKNKPQRFFIITEAEVYKGENDLACHCRNGKTPRSKILYEQGGVFYVYLIYGMYHMLNIVTGKQDSPQAILIRGLQEIVFTPETIILKTLFDGPGKLTKTIGINKNLNGTPLTASPHITIIKIDFPEKTGFVEQAKRVGIEYAEEPWKSIPWRFIFKPKDYEKTYSLYRYHSVLRQHYFGTT